MIKWDDNSDPIPAKICMFLNLENSPLMSEEEHEEFRSSFDSDVLLHESMNNNQSIRDAHHFLTRSKWVVIQSCLSEAEEGIRDDNMYRVESRIASRYYLEEQWRLVEVESIVDTAYCLEVLDNGTDIVCFHDTSKWQSFFLDIEE